MVSSGERDCEDGRGTILMVCATKRASPAIRRSADMLPKGVAAVGRVVTPYGGRIETRLRPPWRAGSRYGQRGALVYSTGAGHNLVLFVVAVPGG